MKKLSFIIVAAIVSFCSCNKSNDNQLTKVGFYFKDSNFSNEGVKSYNLFIDDEFKGKINVFKNTPEEKFLHFENLDSKRHQIDVKDDNGNFLTANYIYFKKDKHGCGTGISANKVKGTNGMSVEQNLEKKYYVSASFKD